ncbi:hypothetical protein [Halalkalibacillus halophilus]|uniref:hypothetical protein n=1 Tax=Halalkalibacillus halophilus TaxID=392827 RepID=UPI000404766F|nr:hypothetical protein [Halalkalibacillus halophilus]
MKNIKDWLDKHLRNTVSLLLVGAIVYLICYANFYQYNIFGIHYITEGDGETATILTGFQYNEEVTVEASRFNDKEEQVEIVARNADRLWNSLNIVIITVVTLIMAVYSYFKIERTRNELLWGIGFNLLLVFLNIITYIQAIEALERNINGKTI